MLYKSHDYQISLVHIHMYSLSIDLGDNFHKNCPKKNDGSGDRSFCYIDKYPLNGTTASSVLCSLPGINIH